MDEIDTSNPLEPPNANETMAEPSESSEPIKDPPSQVVPPTTNGSSNHPTEPPSPPHGTKRPFEDDPPTDNPNPNPTLDATSTSALSKNQQKRACRQQKWESNKPVRAEKRKEKRHNKQERKRLEREAELEQAAKEGREPALPEPSSKGQRGRQTLVPVSIVLDCQFEKYMMEGELVSLSSQVTRCYSDNRKAACAVHLCVSSYGGSLQRRHETVLMSQHLKWKGIEFAEEDFVKVAGRLGEVMRGPEGGTVIPVLQPSSSFPLIQDERPDPSTSTFTSTPTPTSVPEPEASDLDKSIIYLTADSPYTLARLEPHMTYVVGGLIDRNREKGLCYKIARERKVRTAKLPIGEYMVLRDRHVLTTNQVVEIMLRWLELGDWGEAFLRVVPRRKGGVLKEGDEGEGEGEEQPLLSAAGTTALS